MQAAAREGHPAAAEEEEGALLRRLEGVGEAEAEAVALLARVVWPLEQMPGWFIGRGRWIKGPPRRITRLCSITKWTRWVSVSRVRTMWLLRVIVSAEARTGKRVVVVELKNILPTGRAEQRTSAV